MADEPQYLRIARKNPKRVFCPICHNLAENQHKPFCSLSCSQLDLGKWLNGDYAVPAHEAMDDTHIKTLLLAHDNKQSSMDDEDG